MNEHFKPDRSIEKEKTEFGTLRLESFELLLKKRNTPLGWKESKMCIDFIEKSLRLFLLLLWLFFILSTSCCDSVTESRLVLETYLCLSWYYKKHRNRENIIVVSVAIIAFIQTLSISLNMTFDFWVGNLKKNGIKNSRKKWNWEFTFKSHPISIKKSKHAHFLSRLLSLLFGFLRLFLEWNLQECEEEYLNHHTLSNSGIINSINLICLDCNTPSLISFRFQQSKKFMII